MNCCDVDLCETCENSGQHPLNHLVYKTYLTESRPKTLAYGRKELEVCYACGTASGCFHQFISLEENRYYCQKCADSVPNDVRLWKIKCGVSTDIVPLASRGKNPRGACCDIAFPGCLRQCIGINWKCTYCWATDICENCDKVLVQAAKDGKHPVGEKTPHTLACAVMKLYYLYPDYGEWGLNRATLFPSCR